MILRIMLFAMMALGLGGFGIVAWVSTKSSAQAVIEVEAPTVEAPAPAAKIHVLVAARGVRAGSLLKPEEITSREFSSSEVPEGVTVDSPASRHSLVGAMIRRPVGPGEPLIADDMMRPGDHGFLAAVLAPGMRAVTIGVDAVSGTAGLIWPGDRVDVIMTQSIDDPSLPIGRRVLAQTVHRNGRVIAIDQQLVQGALPGGSEGNAARTVTIEVTGEQAQRVQVAARIGRLSLSVRSSDTSDATTANEDYAAVYASDVSSALSGQQPRIVQDVMRLHSGTSESKEFKFR